MPRRDFERFLRNVIEPRYKDADWLKDCTDPLERRRKLANAAMCMKVYEVADRGRLADVRQLIALRLAPWLRPHV